VRIPINREADIPLYQQIETYLRTAILSGALPAETKLPATRSLATDLGVNRITVETAYAGLEADGLTASKVGSGTFVLASFDFETAPEPRGNFWPAWQKSNEILSSPVLRQNARIKSDHGPDFIDFSTGVGAGEMFPVADFRKVLGSVLRENGIAALEYGDPRGFLPLRKTISQVLARQGLQTSPEQVLITGGSQQVIALVSQLILRPGDTVLVEQPTYGGALRLFEAQNLKILAAPMDDDGLCVDQLEDLIQKHRPKLMYVIPNFHNPTGTCLNGHRRRSLIDLVGRYDLPLLEDDFVGDLRYEGRAQPAIKSLDPDGRVIYTSTFSKMLMPGMRVGFLVADGPIYDHLVSYKSVIDLATSNLMQQALDAFVSVGRYQSHLRRAVQKYRSRRDAMIAAIRQLLPDDVEFLTPKGGLFIWVQLPLGMSASRLLSLATQSGISFAVGSDFYSQTTAGDRFIRLNFATNSRDKTIVGIEQLAQAMKILSRG
jgi:GntR family transcriptional regulator / MocR family aminotransferase